MGPGRVDLAASEQPTTHPTHSSVLTVWSHRGRGGRHRRAPQRRYAVSGALVAPVVVLIAWRQTGIAVGPTAAAVALLPWAALLAVIGVVLALRQRALPAIAIGLVSVALVSLWWLPAFRADDDSSRFRALAATVTSSTEGADFATTSARSVRPLRIVSLNTMSSPAAAAHFLRTLTALQPDVVVLSELTAPTAAVVRRSEISRMLPYVTRPGVVDGLGVWSRWPVSEVVAIPLRYGGYRLTVAVPGATAVDIVAAHPVSPRWFAGRAWAADQQTLRDAVDAARDALIVIGDLNMTRDHLPFRQLESVGLRDAADVVGLGWSPTWSFGAGRPHLVAVDHIMVRALGVVRFTSMTIDGSDHRAVAADILVPVRGTI